MALAAFRIAQPKVGQLHSRLGKVARPRVVGLDLPVRIHGSHALTGVLAQVRLLKPEKIVPWILRLQLLHIQAGFGNDSPVVAEAFFLGLLMGLFGFARSVVSVARISAAFNLNGDLVAQPPLTKLFLDSNIGIRGQGNDDLAARGILDHDLALVTRGDVVLNQLRYRQKNVYGRPLSQRVVVAALVLVT